MKKQINENKNPWQKTGSRAIYENPWISVREDAVIHPNGEPGIYGVVHMKNRAIGVLAVDEDGYTYLVGQYRYTLHEYSWEIPEGGGRMDETPEDAAQRELQEETGFTAGRLELLGRAHLSNSVTDEAAFIFLATELTAGEAQPDGSEELQVRRIPVEEALAMVVRGEITDSMSVIALLRFALMQQKAQ